MSLLAHVALLAGAVVATGRAAPRVKEEVRHDLVFIAPPAPSRPTGSALRRSAEGGTSGAVTAREALSAAATGPVVPTVTVPTVDLSAGASPTPTPDAGFSRSIGRGGGTGAAAGDRAVWEGDVVDTPAVPLAGNPLPVYPEALRASGLEGHVVARFIVDTLGRVEPGSVEIVAAGADTRFVDAVRSVLPRLRFRAAAVGAHPVRQRVEQPFTFAFVR